MAKKEGKKRIIQGEIMRASGRNLADLSGGKPQKYVTDKYTAKAAAKMKGGGY